MDARSVVRSAPAELLVGADPPVAYRLAEDVVATHGDAVTVEPLESAPAAHAEVGPVYRLDSGAVAVPTGRALVRFGEGDRADRHREELEAAGYAVEGVPPYAPQAAWVRAAEGGIAEALAGLDRLAGLRDVEHVEPELVMPVSPRS
jgi:hypothetical protein